MTYDTFSHGPAHMFTVYTVLLMQAILLAICTCTRVDGTVHQWDYDVPVCLKVCILLTRIICYSEKTVRIQ